MKCHCWDSNKWKKKFYTKLSSDQQEFWICVRHFVVLFCTFGNWQHSILIAKLEKTERHLNRAQSWRQLTGVFPPRVKGIWKKGFLLMVSALIPLLSVANKFCRLLPLQNLQFLFNHGRGMAAIELYGGKLQWRAIGSWEHPRLNRNASASVPTNIKVHLAVAFSGAAPHCRWCRRRQWAHLAGSVCASRETNLSQSTASSLLSVSLQLETGDKR